MADGGSNTLRVPASGQVCLGMITAPHGVRGEVRIKCFTEDAYAIADYGPLSNEPGTRSFEIEISGPAKGGVRARIAGCTDRDQAEELRGIDLYVKRSALPDPEADEFYYADLEGVRAERADGCAIGIIAAVHNFGGGDVLEIKRPDDQALLIPFTRERVPDINVEQGRVVIDDSLDDDGEVES
tara:strand:- start:408 stop:959 length:552 start_codon:yes stop_codon:yes gene_type:complete